MKRFLMKIACALVMILTSAKSKADVIDYLKIQDRIEFSDGSVQTSSYSMATSVISSNLLSISNDLDIVEQTIPWLVSGLGYVSNYYVKADGTKAMTGNLNMGGNSITNFSSMSNGGSRIVLSGGIAEIFGDIYVNGAGDEFLLSNRGDGVRVLSLGYGLRLVSGNLNMGQNAITNISNTTNAFIFRNGTRFGPQSVSNWNIAYSAIPTITVASATALWSSNTANWASNAALFASNKAVNAYDVAYWASNTATWASNAVSETSDVTNRLTNYWLIGSEITNAIPKVDSVTSQSIAANAVESDEINSGAVTISKLSPSLLTNDLYAIGSSIGVDGIRGKSIPSLTGNQNTVLGVDSNLNWHFTTAGQGDMLMSDYSTNGIAGNWVDRSRMSAITTNATGILGKLVVTNGRIDESVIAYDDDAGRYYHVSLSSLGFGDMLRATYDTNSNDIVDLAEWSINSRTSSVSTNTVGFLGKPAVTNGRVDEAVIAYDDDLGRYYHISLSSLGYGDMLKSVYDTNANDRVDQIDTNSVGSAQIIDLSVSTGDIANGAITPPKTIGILSTNSSFSGGDMDGTYNTLTVQKIKGKPVSFGPTGEFDVVCFNEAGSITSRPINTVKANITAHVLTIDNTTSNVSFGLSNKYYYIDITSAVTNWTIGVPTGGDGAIYKLDMNYDTNQTFAWGGSLIGCTNLPSPPPEGKSSYIFEIMVGTTNIIAYP